MSTRVIGIFDHVSAANDAVNALLEAGFAKEDVRVSAMASEDALAERRRRPRNMIVRRYLTPPSRGPQLGLVIGFITGALLGLLMSTGVLVVMGEGQAQFVGPVLATIIGAVVFGVFGAFFGFVSNADLPTLDPQEPLDESFAKRTVVSVATDDTNAAAARVVMEQHKAHGGAKLWRRDDGSWVPAATA